MKGPKTFYVDSERIIPFYGKLFHGKINLQYDFISDNFLKLHIRKIKFITATAW